MSISAALIVRDEADHLPSCLQCLIQAVDEICVVDTGSTDNTVEIARRFGAKVAAFPWTHDFSEARNRALELCTCDWILSIDADECIALEDMPLLRVLTGPGVVAGYRFVTRNYTNQNNLSEFHFCEPGDAMARGFRGWTPSTKVRLFPNRLGVRFEGPVHELVNEALERIGVPLADAPFPIHHYHLMRSEERLRKKRELYLALGRRKVEQNPESAKAHLELANQYIELGEITESVRSFKEALRLAPHDAVILRGLGAALHLAGHGAEAERALDLSLRIEADSPEAWRNLGVVRAAKEDWAGAESCFRNALAVDPEWSEGFRYLSVALDHLGRVEEAVEAAEAAVVRDPACDGSLQHYVELMTRLARREDARKTLLLLVSQSTGASPVRKALENL